jgi:hypothetical protein
MPVPTGSCRICSSPTTRAFDTVVLRRHSATFVKCSQCGFLATDGAPHWLSEAYASPINIQDTGLVGRNIAFARDASVLLYCFFDPSAKFVDYAGGHGLFTRLMRDVGFDFRTLDPLTENLFARGFSADPSDAGFEAVTSFESFEHFLDPRTEIGKMLRMSRTLVFSTVLLPEPVPDPTRWWYYGFAHGQHISFYERRTLEFIAKSHGCRLFAFGPFHLLTDRDLSPWRLALVARLRRPAFARVRRAMRSLTVPDHDALSVVGGDVK